MSTFCTYSTVSFHGFVNKNNELIGISPLSLIILFLYSNISRLLKAPSLSSLHICVTLIVSVVYAKDSIVHVGMLPYPLRNNVKYTEFEQNDIKSLFKSEDRLCMEGFAPFTLYTQQKMKMVKFFSQKNVWWLSLRCYISIQKQNCQKL